MDKEKEAFEENLLYVVSIMNGYLKQIEQLKAENERLKSFIKDIRDNYDCDENGHGYSTGCRCCEAKELLEVLNKE